MLEYENVIHWVMKINAPLISAMRLDRDDVFQDLSIAAILAIDGFNPEKCDSLFTHLVSRLQYEILRMKKRYVKQGVTGSGQQDIQFLSLDIMVDGMGPEVRSESPYELVELIDVLSQLPKAQQTVIIEKISGNYHWKRQDPSLLDEARDVIRTCYERGVTVCG